MSAHGADAVCGSRIPEQVKLTIKHIYIYMFNVYMILIDRIQNTHTHTTFYFPWHTKGSHKSSAPTCVCVGTCWICV